MSFTSLTFFAFLATAFAVYYLAPGHRWQNAVLLAGGLCFALTAGMATLCVLCLDILLAYGLALLLERAPAAKRRCVLAGGTAAFLAVLLGMKYSGMLLDTVALFWPGVSRIPALSRLVGVAGISYYTLMAVGYLADVYRGRIRAEHSLLRVALFLSFFPQFTSGPIGRAGELLPQFAQERNFDYEQFACGLTRMLIGYFKKLVIADSLGLAVDAVFARPQDYAGPLVILAALAFSYQLYCDFFGYTDIARGMGEIFGIRLRENFRRPFAARSFSELWNRWHISLSEWFRDYVYIPMGGSRRGTLRMCAATMTVFALSGLWHETGWLFLLWGVLNGLFVMAEKLTKRQRNALAARIPGYQGSPMQSVWQRISVYLIFSFCFVLFRVGEISSAGLAQCAALYGQMLAGWGILLQPQLLVQQLKTMSIGRKLLLYLTAAILLNEGLDLRANQRGRDTASYVRGLGAVPRSILYYIMLLMILFFGQIGQSSFIYFQFNGR